MSATATAQQASALVLSPEQRKELRELRARIMQEHKTPEHKTPLEQPKLQAGTPIGRTEAPEAPAPENPFDGAVSDDTLGVAERLGRFGNID